MRGSLQQKRGKWYVVVRVNGKPKWMPTGETEKRKAERKMPAIVLAAMNGEITDSDDISVKEYLKKWLRLSCRVSVGDSTYTTYVWVAQRVTAKLGQKKLIKLTALDMQEYLAEELKAGISPLSVIYQYKAVRRALNKAIEWKILRENIMYAVTPPAKPKYKPEIYSAEQVEILLNEVVKGKEIELPTVLAVTVGLRRGECCALRFEEVNFETQVANIMYSLKRVGDDEEDDAYLLEEKPKRKRSAEDVKELTMVDTKTDHSDRKVKLPQFTFSYIQSAYMKREKMKLKHGEAFDDRGFCWFKRNGDPYDPDFLYKQFKKLVIAYNKKVDALEAEKKPNKGKLPVIRFHDLRHSCASYLIRLGVSVEDVSKMLGHAKHSFTHDVYIHVIEDTSSAAANAVDQRYGPKEEQEKKKEKESG